jgi:hypothetical protein
MNMRKLVWITAAIAALAGAGMAVAHQVDSKSVKPVSATFTATTPSVVRTSTCTGPDGTYTTTRATYTGTATSSEPTLNGPISIDTQSLLNTTTNVGAVSGKITIGSGGGSTHFAAVYSNGNVAGLATGNGGDEHWQGNQLLANLSAGFTTAGGFTNGKLGGGTTGGDAVQILPGGCQPTPTPKPDTIQVHGAVTGVTATTISAAGVTCTIPTTLSATVTGLALTTGSQIEMTCTVAAGVNTLAHISAGGHGDGHHSDQSSHSKRH